MAQISALLVLAMTLASEASVHQSDTTTKNPNSPTTQPVCKLFACPNGYDRINVASTANNFYTCCRERVSTTAEKDSKNGVQNIVSTTLAIGTTKSETTQPSYEDKSTTAQMETTKTETPQPWYEKKLVKKGLIEGGAAAGFATLAGLGVGALVMANKETTQPPIPSAARALPQTVQTTPQMTVTVTTPTSEIKARAEDEGSSFNLLLLVLLLFLAVFCCFCLIGYCVFMKTRKRSTTLKRTPSMPRRKEAEYHQEAFPLIHEQAPPPAPVAHTDAMFSLPSGLTASSYVPATTVMPAEYMLPTTVPQLPSPYAPATTFATGPIYAPASAYVPATTQYAGVGTPAFV
jgi:hypothetical protein